MDKMADAASTGLSKMSKLTHVRVVEEGDLNTDKEGLFASAPGSKMLVKLSEGVEKIKSTLAGGREGKEGKGGAGGGAADDIYGSITIEGAPPPTHSVAGSAHASTVKVRKAPTPWYIHAYPTIFTPLSLNRTTHYTLHTTYRRRRS